MASTKAQTEASAEASGKPRADQLEKQLLELKSSFKEIQDDQRAMAEHVMSSNVTSRLETLERKQDEVIRLLSSLRCELAGISSGMARRDSLMLGTGLQSLRRDSLLPDSLSRRSSFLGEAFIAKAASFPVMEVAPWTPTPEVQQQIDRLLERQFLLSPWMKEKRLRNQLRLILKDHLDAGPQRRSTVTKIVHEAHQIFPVWRGQIKDTLFEHWEKVQEMAFPEAAEIIFSQFKKPRFPDELESTQLYAEHMIEVGQYLKRKIVDRAVKAGKTPPQQASITNSKFWYEVRKKINEVLETQKNRRLSNAQVDADSDGDDDSLYHSPVSPQGSVQGDEEEDCCPANPTEERKQKRFNDSGLENSS